MACQRLTNFVPLFKMLGENDPPFWKSSKRRPGDEVGVQLIECITQSILNIFGQFPYMRVVQRYKLIRQSLLFEDSFLFMFNHTFNFSVVCSVTWHLNGSEARGDVVAIQRLDHREDNCKILYSRYLRKCLPVLLSVIWTSAIFKCVKKSSSLN